MTEGMPARSSIPLLRKEEIGPFLQYSPKNIDTEREKGIQMNNAQKEVSSVPTRKGRAPNFPKTGSHVLSNKKSILNALSEGRESTQRVTKMERSSSSRQIAEKLSTP